MSIVVEFSMWHSQIPSDCMDQSWQVLTSLLATSFSKFSMNSSNLVRASEGDRLDSSSGSFLLILLMYLTILALKGFPPVAHRAQVLTLRILFTVFSLCSFGSHFMSGNFQLDADHHSMS